MFHGAFLLSVSVVGESADNALEHSIVGELEKPRKPTDFMSGIGEHAAHIA
jgi:hypothetical protein